MARLHRVIISVRDLTTSHDFYADRLGLAPLQAQGETELLSIGDGIELLLHQRETTPSDLSISVAFSIEDLDGTCSRWAADGGTIVDEPADQPWGERMAVVRDPDGHLICLVQQA
ncbi:VOC family protein [Nocardioides maradonensis]